MPKPFTRWLPETDLDLLKKMKADYTARSIKTRIVSKKMFLRNHAKKEKVYALKMVLNRRLSPSRNNEVTYNLHR